MDIVLQVLRVLNYIFGGAVLLVGFGAYIFSGALVPLLLALGLAAVGPHRGPANALPAPVRSDTGADQEIGRPGHQPGICDFAACGVLLSL